MSREMACAAAAGFECLQQFIHPTDVQNGSKLKDCCIDV